MTFLETRLWPDFSESGPNFFHLLFVINTLGYSIFLQIIIHSIISETRETQKEPCYQEIEHHVPPLQHFEQVASPFVSSQLQEVVRLSHQLIQLRLYQLLHLFHLLCPQNLMLSQQHRLLSPQLLLPETEDITNNYHAFDFYDYGARREQEKWSMKAYLGHFFAELLHSNSHFRSLHEVIDKLHNLGTLW